MQQLAMAIAEGLSTQPLDAFASGFASMAASVSSGIDALISKFNALAAAAREAAAAASGASGGGGGGDEGGSDTEEFATGGMIGGKGGVDNNLIWASADEFMIRARAVRKYGIGMLRAINEGRFKLPKFDGGGLIGSLGGSMAVRGPTFSMAAPQTGGSEFIDLGLPGGVVIPVTVTANVGRSIRQMAQQNRLNSIAKVKRG
jgi:hypothetical protein